MNAKRHAASLLLGALLAACAGTPTSPPPAGSPSAPSPITITTSGPTIAPSASPAATSPTPQATPLPELTPSAASLPPPSPTPDSVPPKPTGATFHEDVECLDPECHKAETTQAVTWRTPRTKGVTIRVYGVTECLAEPAHPKLGTSGPCLVTHTRLPASVRTLLAKAPASAGKVSWSWATEIGCDISPFSSDPNGPLYVAVVLAAYNKSGQSIFTIAESGHWSRPLPIPGWMPC